MPERLLRDRLRRDRFFQLGVFFVSAVVIAAIFAPWLAPHNPLTGDLRNAYLVEPGSRFLLGTDSQGRDVLSRVLYGARLSLSVGIISQSVAVSVGVLLGLMAGYYGRWVDALVIRLVGWAGMARLVRSQVLVLKRAEFVLAARALGALDRRVLLRHLLPNVRTQVIISATLGVAAAIMAEAALSFVGLGAQPPTPSWGAMVADGRDLLRVAPWISFAPGLAIGIAVLGFNLVGDGLREAYDPKLRTER